MLKKGGQVVALIKPQFEAGREKVGKKGVVRDKAVHLEVIEAAMGYARDNGFSIGGLTYSPVKGPEGNIEYLIWLIKEPDTEIEDSGIDPQKTVEESHQDLDR